MKTFRYRFLFLLSLISTSLLAVNGQDTKFGVESTVNVIEVHSDGTRPASMIALRGDRPSGFWTSNFPRVKDWKLPSGEEPIQVVNFSAKLIGDRAESIITVFRGKRFGEIKEPIATVVLSEGESAIVSELTKYGFETLTIKMVKAPLTVANLPIVSNPSQALRTWVIPVVSTLPAFKVKLFNDSSRSILAVVWHTEAAGRRLISSLPYGKYGSALIVPNGEYEMNLRANSPNPLTDTVTFVIDAVVYGDGLVEGDASHSEPFHSFRKGHKDALSRLVPILLSATEVSSRKLDVARLIARIDSVRNVHSSAPNGRPSTASGIAFDAVVTELLEAVGKLNAQSTGKTDAEISKTLQELTSLYAEWLDRLSR